MSGYLTTHVLDTARGVPAAGIRIALYSVEDQANEPVADTVTNSDGRTNSPILPAETFKTGKFELVFYCGDYLEKHGLSTGYLKFLDEIPIRFSMDDPTAHYHVPLLLSPFGYSTYRGS